jgi:AAA15 family ATPase/GTPase
LDTGISRIGGEDVDLSKIDFTPKDKESINRLPEGRSLKFYIYNEIVIVTRKSDHLSAKRLTSYHRKSDGSEVPFSLYMESDGTKRVLNIVPAIINLLFLNSYKVCVIDEIDRLLVNRPLESNQTFAYTIL